MSTINCITVEPCYSSYAWDQQKCRRWVTEPELLAAIQRQGIARFHCIQLVHVLYMPLYMYSTVNVTRTIMFIAHVHVHVVRTSSNQIVEIKAFNTFL